MFSGKTDELIRRARAARAAGRTAVVAKPAIDTRHPPDVLVSHSGERIDAVTVARSADLLGLDADTLLVDEVQFFDDELPAVLERIGVDVVATGLDLDFRREPFPTTAALVAVADVVDRFTARCGRCGRAASVTQRLLNGRPAPLDDPVVRIGDDELYEPRCVDCWEAERMSSDDRRTVSLP
jgi:thymidine kinase